MGQVLTRSSGTQKCGIISSSTPGWRDFTTSTHADRSDTADRSSPPHASWNFSRFSEDSSLPLASHSGIGIHRVFMLIRLLRYKRQKPGTRRRGGRLARGVLDRLQ
ncbi:hypothetical protein, partial [Streptomyces scabiei]|uniref:hypothetical protein n=1 Tax=Streptomyces scabiei TaxID=1930 RepID=UPI001B32DC34